MSLKKPRTEGEKARAALAAHLREQDRQRLAELAAALEGARRGKREALLGVRSLCRTERDRLKKLAEDLRRQAHTVALTRRDVRETCATNRMVTRGEGDRVVDRAKEQARREREHQRSLRRFAKPASRGPALARGVAGGRRAAEIRSESDDEVRQNIDPILLPLWQRVRNQIKATPRQTRTEAFLAWVHDHPEAHYEISEAQASAELRRLEHEHAAHARAIRHPGRYRRSAAELAAAVPF